MATATTAAKTRAAKATAAPAEEAIEAADAPAEAAPKQETESQKRNRLRNEAERVIINRYKSEFEDVATDLFAKNGLKFNKRMTEEQKAAAKVKELIAANPAMKDEILALLGVAAVPAVAAGQPAAVASAAPVEYDVPMPEEGHYANYGEDQFKAGDAPVSGAWDQAPAQQ